MQTAQNEKTEKQPPVELRATMSLLDATAVGVGSIIGAGIFVVTGIVAGIAGPALVVSVLISAVISLLTALSVAELAHHYPEEGGIYEYARETISPFIGFLTGWMWVVSSIFGGASVALGFGYYFAGVVPFLPPQVVAAILCLVLCGVNTAGGRSSSLLNNILVAAKLLILLFFVLFGAMHINSNNFVPFEAFGLNVFQGAYFIFFAFSGFARVAVVAGEVKHARKNVPRAILLSLLISAVFYIAVGFVAVGVAGASTLGASNSPLADAARITGSAFGARIVSLGALIATTTVLLTSVLGTSRMLYAMAGTGEFPKFLARLHSKYGTPYYAIWLPGVLMAVLVLITDLTQVVAISTFASLFYYFIANLSALRMRPDQRQYPQIVSTFGAATCVGLLFFSAVKTPSALYIGLLALLAGVIYHTLLTRYRPPRV